MNLDNHYRLTRDGPSVRGSAKQESVLDDQDNNLTLRIVVASMPLMGLALCIMTLALWNLG